MSATEPRKEHHGDDVGMQAVVGRLHRPFVFEIGGVAHAADDGRGMLVAGEVARQTGIDSPLRPGGCPHRGLR